MKLILKNKNISKVIIVVFACALSSLLLDAETHKWELKVNAGAAYSGIGRFNDFMDRLGWNMTGEGWKHAHWGMDASAKIVYRFDKNHGISLGTGFLRFTQETADGIYYGSDNEMSRFKTRIQAVPLTLNLHYTLPLGQKFRIGISAGPGLYFGQFTLKNDVSWLDGLHKLEKKTHGAALGGQAAIGLEIDLGSHFALTAEINGRLVRFAKMMEKVQSWNNGKKDGQVIKLPYTIDLSGVGLGLGVKLFL